MNKEKLIEQLLEQTEKVFFYCVKRCNSRVDAEDLSQEILLDIIININKEIKIENFDYYIWQICKNHYSKYISKKVKERENVTYLEDINEPADNINFLDELVKNEKISMINTAIKLLSSDYSEILYSYYVEDNTLVSIAEKLNLPLGTIKRRLFDIRNKLKEYIKMERLNGEKAYVPKEFSGILSYEDNLGFNPHKETGPLLIKNLLFHSYNNPSTIEDYSIELGVSRPYVEDYVEKLEKYDLLRKVDDKYITTFAFIDRKMAVEIETLVKENIDDYQNSVIGFCVKNIDYYRSLLVNMDIPDNLLLWSFILITLATSSFSIVEDYTMHVNGEKFDFLMVEEKNKKEDDFFISYNSNKTPNTKYTIKNFPSSSENTKNIVCNRISYKNNILQSYFWKVKELLGKEINCIENNEDVKKLIDNHYLTVVDGKLTINVPMMKEFDFQKLIETIKKNETLLTSYKMLAVKVKEKNIIPEYYQSQVNFIVSAVCNITRSIVLNKAYDMGLLDLDEECEYFSYNTLIIED